MINPKAIKGMYYALKVMVVELIAIYLFKIIDKLEASSAHGQDKIKQIKYELGLRINEK